jgi:hypothetical protein
MRAQLIVVFVKITKIQILANPNVIWFLVLLTFNNSPCKCNTFELPARSCKSSTFVWLCTPQILSNSARIRCPRLGATSLIVFVFDCKSQDQSRVLYTNLPVWPHLVRYDLPKARHYHEKVLMPLSALIPAQLILQAFHFIILAWPQGSGF